MKRSILLSLMLAAAAVGLVSAVSFAQDAKKEDKEEKQPRGLVHRAEGIAPGYTLISPFSKTSAYLLDADAQVVKQWESRYRPGLAPYLLPNGNLLRGIQVEHKTKYGAGGIAGGLQEFSPDGKLLWEFQLSSDLVFHHHDVEVLPNGNILMIAWESVTKEEALAAGRMETHAGDDGMWPCTVVEIEPLRPVGARIVWQWRAWDHLIQDQDPDKPDYGVIAENPHRIDINADIKRDEDEPDEESADTAAAQDSGMSAEERRRLIALGYLDESDADTDNDNDNDNDNDSDGHGNGDGHGDDKKLSDREKRDRERADWLHLNGIDYNADLDQIVVSSWYMNEIWIIDHSTTLEEAAGSTGGRSGMGGDLLYRWGNPQAYRSGSSRDRQLFHQHDPQWIPDGYPGAGNITIFNNGRHRPDKEYSSVLEIVPPLQADGTYAKKAGAPFGPERPVWEYAGTEDDRFYASFISGAHRLSNGNTLICSGPHGRVFEVTKAGEIVWDLYNPFGSIPDDGEINDMTYGMFRATRIAPDHPGLRGAKLTPIDPQPKTAEELFAERPPAGEKPSGWVDLISKETRMSRWRNVNCARSTFSVEPDSDRGDDAVLLKCTGKPTGIMRSDRMYENFIVDFEWRHMEEGGNAGFFVWADPLPATGGPYTRGIEVQVCNLGNGSWFTSHGDIFPIWGATMTPDPRFRISGSRSMPNEDAYHANPTGEWNHYRITAIDGAVTLEVNGKLVTAGSACSPSKGYLCLESEGGEVHFRGLRIWELPAGSNAADEARTATEAGDHRTLYNGLDLDKWTIKSGDWAAADWRITGSEDAVIVVPVPERPQHVFFDYKRDESAKNLPFALDGVPFERFAEEAAGKWQRIHLRTTDEGIVIEVADKRRLVPKKADGTWYELTLVTGDVATEFASVFADGKFGD